ncbi:MAG: isoamylase early set domain-containing protein [Thermodesulfobacteriota bacterium]
MEGGSEIKTTLGKEKAKEGKTKKVDFNFSAPHAGSISIAGDFNDWDPGSHPMKKDKKGAWKISLNLAPRTYQYRFYVDGDWQNDPGCTGCVENPFGGQNCVTIVS